MSEVDICHVGAGFCCLVIPLIFVLVFGLSYWLLELSNYCKVTARATIHKIFHKDVNTKP